MPNPQIVDFYERVPLHGATRHSEVFLYVLHYKNANHLQIGFGMESLNGLNVAHVFGPNVHEFHIPALLDWCRQGVFHLVLEDEYKGRHPFSSEMTVDLVKRLAEDPVLPLVSGRYSNLVREHVGNATVLVPAIQRARDAVWGHPADWDIRPVSLADGRVMWIAYDSEIDKIRCGIGYFDASNAPVYGDPCYAVGKMECEKWVAWHFLYKDAPLEFFGRPSGWPVGFEMMLYDIKKQTFMVEFLKLADEIWG